MFALSHDGHRAFMCDPAVGMRIPVVVMLETGRTVVSMPMVHELANRYAVYDDFASLERAITDPEQLSAISRARSFSILHSERLKARLDEGGLTISQVADLVAAQSV